MGAPGLARCRRLPYQGWPGTPVRGFCRWPPGCTPPAGARRAILKDEMPLPRADRGLDPGRWMILPPKAAQGHDRPRRAIPASRVCGAAPKTESSSDRIMSGGTPRGRRAPRGARGRPDRAASRAMVSPSGRFGLGRCDLCRPSRSQGVRTARSPPAAWLPGRRHPGRPVLRVDGRCDAGVETARSDTTRQTGTVEVAGQQTSDSWLASGRRRAAPPTAEPRHKWATEPINAWLPPAAVHALERVAEPGQLPDGAPPAGPAQSVSSPSPVLRLLSACFGELPSTLAPTKLGPLTKEPS